MVFLLAAAMCAYLYSLIGTSGSVFDLFDVLRSVLCPFRSYTPGPKIAFLNSSHFDVCFVLGFRVSAKRAQRFLQSLLSTAGSLPSARSRSCVELLLAAKADPALRWSDGNAMTCAASAPSGEAMEVRRSLVVGVTP